MSWHDIETMVGGFAAFLVAALGAMKLWRDSARNTTAIDAERQERKADIDDLRGRTDERLTAVEQKMSARFYDLNKCLTGMRDDLAADRLDMSKNYLTKADGEKMQAEAEKRHVQVLEAIKELKDHSDKRWQMAFESMKGREAR